MSSSNVFFWEVVSIGGYNGRSEEEVLSTNMVIVGMYHHLSKGYIHRSDPYKIYTFSILF